MTALFQEGNSLCESFLSEVKVSFCGEMSLISLGPIPVKVTIPASLEKIFEIRVGDLSSERKRRFPN